MVCYVTFIDVPLSQVDIKEVLENWLCNIVVRHVNELLPHIK